MNIININQNYNMVVGDAVATISPIMSKTKPLHPLIIKKSPNDTQFLVFNPHIMGETLLLFC